MATNSRHLRPRDGGEQPTTSVELLFDLVYLFAVTQLSHLLIDHLTVAAVLSALAVWEYVPFAAVEVSEPS